MGSPGPGAPLLPAAPKKPKPNGQGRSYSRSVAESLVVCIPGLSLDLTVGLNLTESSEVDFSLCRISEE